MKKFEFGELVKITAALGKMFAPFCEVVLHDLTHPENAIVYIENNLTGRAIGDPTTEIGIKRIKDKNFPDVIQNYKNIGPNGEVFKSTSIGIRDDSGAIVASICLNFDTSKFKFFSTQIAEFVSTTANAASDNFNLISNEDLEEDIIEFASKNNSTPTALGKEKKRELILILDKNGLLHIKGGITKVSKLLGLSRTSIYKYINEQT